MTDIDWIRLVRERFDPDTSDPARDEELVEELAHHLGLRYAELIDAGVPPAVALPRVLAEIGDARDVAAMRRNRPAHPPAPLPPPTAGRSRMLDDLWHDVRYGVRVLARSKAFAAAAILTLALGIGATTAIYSVVDAVLLRPVPFDDLDRLTMVW
ncbi:MAG TPA: permease prefix domain 1-containing protein, partial [Gemmatimonadaceae bacterium]